MLAEKLPFTAAILAGGKNTRFGGEIKSLQIINRKEIIAHQLKVLNKLFDEVLILSNKIELFTKYSNKVIEDIIKDRGPLGGIYTALTHAKNRDVFIVACDMPFLKDTDIITQCECYIRNKSEALIPKHSEGIEPLHGIYSKKILATVKAQLEKKELSTKNLLEIVHADYWDVDTLQAFKNINTPEDLKRLNF